VLSFAAVPAKLHYVQQLGKKRGNLNAGDYIGVIYNRVDRTIAFTKNGVHLGVAFRNVYEERLYPTVSFEVFASDLDILHRAISK
jgi:hypothetical protein